MFEPVPGVHARAHIAPHDELGSASFRFVVATGGKPRHLGWATDVGRPTDDLAKHLAGVDVLAIESNYCPVMERESDRPEFLKRRVMGGSVASRRPNTSCCSTFRGSATRPSVRRWSMRERGTR
jgi:hypothetical protein